MRILLLLYIFCFFSSLIFAQSDNFNVKGSVFSVSTDEPIQYANVFIKNTVIGTTSDENGKFQLSIPKTNINDTIIVSMIGYKQFKERLSNINQKNNYKIELEDSLFLLSEVVALCYDNIEALKWKNKKNDKTQYLLTFATRELQNAANFASIVKEVFGGTKLKKNYLKWKKVRIPNIPDKVDIVISWFRCPYCPEESNITVTIEVFDRKNKNLIENEAYRKPLSHYFQSLLDKTFAQGVDYSQLEERQKIAYLKKGTDPYQGKCYGYFETGQKGLRGEYIDGKKEGFWEYWYSNGQKKIEGYYKNGKKTGQWRYWYQDGQLRMEANYIDDNLDGRNIWYWENGQKKKEAVFKNGVYLEKTEWDEKGKVIDATHYLH